METFFTILEVLGVTPEEFFREDQAHHQIVYRDEDSTRYVDEENGYELKWLISDSNEKEMEPILLTFEKEGEYKTFEPSLAETFIYVLDGTIALTLGDTQYKARKGQSVYYQATEPHQLKNIGRQKSRVLVVVTDSYL